MIYQKKEQEASAEARRGLGFVTLPVGVYRREEGKWGREEEG